MKPARTRKSADERRRELAEVAAGHFHRVGFHRISLAALAADVGVTAPAVYRHFRNKNDLLAGAISTGLDHVEAALTGAASLEEAVVRLADAALDRPDVWVLLQREMRHLDSAAGDLALARFRELAATFADHVRRTRPELDDGAAGLLTTAAFAVLATPSTRPVPLGRNRYRAALAALATAACSTELPRVAPGGSFRAPDRPTAAGARRRTATSDRLLDAAVDLFHRHGYAAVRVDDVGEAAGMAGPSVFHHYPAKADLLVAAFRRAEERPPLPHDDGPDAAVRAYVDVAVRERPLFGVYATEEIHLPPAARLAHDDALRAETGRWTAALRPVRPDLDGTGLELLVHAARGIVHDVVRVGRLHTRTGIADETAAVVLTVLTGS